MTWDMQATEAGSYPDVETANRCATAIIRAHEAEVRAFMDSGRARCRPLRLDFDEPVGRVVTRDGDRFDSRHAVLLLHNAGGRPLIFATYPAQRVEPPSGWPELELLFGAYLHPDWLDDAEDPVEAVRTYDGDARDELDRLLSTGTEDDRREIVRSLGSAFVPRPAGELDRFLRAVRELGRPAVHPVDGQV